MSSKALAQTQDKALQLNLASTIYGTFAEIGAGQETANWFFRASGAAGTVVKTISAYDMTVSDTLYGPVKRYVSEERLKGMLDYEFSQLINRLGPQRGKDTRFFAFCNTVKVKGYRDNGPWHGWIGVRFQLKPEAKPSDLIIHVRLNDPDHDRQMKDLGILGVNILHAVFFKRDRLEEFIESLVDNLDPRLVEIDVVRFEGHGFSMVDNRLFALQLVQSGLTPATLFLANGQVAQAADVLYKRPIVLMRGSFNPVCNLHLEVMAQVKKTFLSHINETQADRCMEICEISMNNLLRGDDVDHLEFLDRADSLKALGKNVLITKMARFDNLSGLLARYTREPIAIALSTTFCPKKWTPDERRNGIVNYIMGLCFVTEGAIPYAAADPLRVLPSCVIGAALSGALSMTFGCALRAPHGGIFVFPVVDHAVMYCVALAVGSVVGAVILSLLKKTRTEE